MTIRRSRTLPKRGFLRRLANAQGGVAAIEFALILPVMLLLYLGTAELSQGLIASNKAGNVAFSLADLVGEQAASTDLTDSEVADIFAAAKAIVSPYPTSTLKMTISSVEFVTDSQATTGFDAKVRWTITDNGGTPRPCQILTPVAGNSASPTTMPTGIYPPAGSAQATSIVADLTYGYTPPFGQTVLAWSTSSGSMTFAHTSYMRPRNQYAITYSGSTGTICPAY